MLFAAHPVRELQRKQQEKTITHAIPVHVSFIQVFTKLVQVYTSNTVPRFVRSV
jgi:hypothetical protein